jgi:coenzyme F420-0:L-glutamate ligase/coenzyme F420-1:gamma-L-glutamate ligase
MSVAGIPLVQPGDDLPTLIQAALDRAGMALQAGDCLVVTSKIVSKAEGRRVALADVTPSPRALEVAASTQKDPRIVQLVLDESRAISRMALNVLVTEHRLGFVSANAGIDQSNTADGDESVLLLPLDPDASAAHIRAALGGEIGVVISDSHGRPFRLGNVGVAIGVAGMPALLDLRGQSDLFGRELRISMQGYADLVASTAQLAGGEGNEGLPVTLIRGLNWPSADGRASDLLRPAAHDLYR